MLEQVSSIITLQRHDIEVDELARKVSAFDPLIKKKSLAAEALKTEANARLAAAADQLALADRAARVSDKLKTILN